MSIVPILTDAAFIESFGKNAILVEKGGYEFYEKPDIAEINQKITAFRCEDDITVFAVRRINDEVKSIMAWRFYDRKEPKVDDVHCNESILDMQLKFHELIKPDADCYFFVVGGTMETTVGEGCLLDRIRKAIHGYFIKPKIQVVIRENESWKSNRHYVTAKIEMDGKLTDCYHN